MWRAVLVVLRDAACSASNLGAAAYSASTGGALLQCGGAAWRAVMASCSGKCQHASVMPRHLDQPFRDTSLRHYKYNTHK